MCPYVRVQSDEDEGGWEIDSKQVELKRENARLKQREKQLAGMLDKAKKDIESKDRHILQLKVELEKKKERNRRMDSVATIMCDLGLAVDEPPGDAKHGSEGLPQAEGDKQQEGAKGRGDEDGVENARKSEEAENQELRKVVSELRELLEKKDEELTALGERLEGLEQAVRDKEREIKLLKKEVEKEKVQRIDLQINKEKDKLVEVERTINDKNEIKKLKQELRNKEKEVAALSERLATKEAEWKTRADQYEHEVKSLSRTIENFGRTKW
jgi:predicted RNase H-like nuclease (RuvC/YqgF family)